MKHHADATDPADTEETFVQRWARRKHEARKASSLEPAAEAQAPAAPPVAEPEREPESPSDADMPPLDSLGEGSDISAFFSPGVSETLRQAALQRIFRQPKFNYSDGLDVYCGDYRSFKPIGNIMTAAMRHRLEVARERLASLGNALDTDPLSAGAQPTDRLAGGQGSSLQHANRETSPDPATGQDPEDDDNGYA